LIVSPNTDCTTYSFYLEDTISYQGYQNKIFSVSCILTIHYLDLSGSNINVDVVDDNVVYGSQTGNS
jgi:hypothetical protein